MPIVGRMDRDLANGEGQSHQQGKGSGRPESPAAAEPKI
jgi:hypothetical protein